MNKEEIKQIIGFMQTNYPNFNFKKELIDYWKKELANYDFNDIDTRIKQLMSDERYAYQPPLLEAITRGLTKKDNKVDFSKLTYFCRICRKPFNDQEELQVHEDRCSSIRYIKSQYKRFGWASLTGTQIKEMYNMPEEEFDEKYKIILRKVQKLTTDEMEKTRIEFIFNPPTKEQAIAFFQNN